jgi:hypothetical protein
VNIVKVTDNSESHALAGQIRPEQIGVIGRSQRRQMIFFRPAPDNLSKPRIRSVAMMNGTSVGCASRKPTWLPIACPQQGGDALPGTMQPKPSPGQGPLRPTL